MSLRNFPLPFNSDPRGGAHSPSTDRKFALRMEDDRLLLTIATTSADSTHELQVDHVAETTGKGWLAKGNWQDLIEALKELDQRHQIAGHPVAVSLSGDHCVTRVTTGSIEQINEAWESLSHRIPRYLQLGPGGKVVGQSRETIAPGTEHALTAVGNGDFLRALYDAFESCGWKVCWIEPSLVSLSRLVGLSGLDQKDPVLIADNYGKSWEVGISYQGRLLLDYRPASVTNSESLANVIQQHLKRLRRFCFRNRDIDGGELNQLLLGGNPADFEPLMQRFAKHDDLRVSVLNTNDAEVRLCGINVPVESDEVAAVAAVLPMTRQIAATNIPDLLQSLRREPGHSPLFNLVTMWAPALAAGLFLLGTFQAVRMERQRAEQQSQARQVVERRMRSNRVRLAEVQSIRYRVENLQRLLNQSEDLPVERLVRQIAQCLPPGTHLQRFRLDGDQRVMLEAQTDNEAEVYEVVGHLRRLPGIARVALLSTNPNHETGITRFEMQLGWQGKQPHSIADQRINGFADLNNDPQEQLGAQGA